MRLKTEKLLHDWNPDPGEKKARRKQKKKSPQRSEEEKGKCGLLTKSGRGTWKWTR